MADVQVSVNDLLAAFAQEAASLTQRAVIAEQRAKAYAQQVERLEAQIAALATPEPEATPDPAPTRTVRRGRTTTPE